MKPIKKKENFSFKIQMHIILQRKKEKKNFSQLLNFDSITVLLPPTTNITYLKSTKVWSWVGSVAVLFFPSFFPNIPSADQSRFTVPTRSSTHPPRLSYCSILFFFYNETFMLNLKKKLRNYYT